MTDDTSDGNALRLVKHNLINRKCLQNVYPAGIITVIELSYSAGSAALHFGYPTVLTVPMNNGMPDSVSIIA